MTQNKGTTENGPVDIIVSGHLCIDLIPTMRHVTTEAMTRPGALNETGPLVVSTGGAVSNVGLTLYRLGERVGLMGTVGDDLIGDLTTGYLRSHDPSLTRFLTVKEGQASSYTVTLSPLGADRTFLHCPATNDVFGHEDIDFDVVAGATIFHLGYPALMARLRENGGDELCTIFRLASERGVVTSLDMALPDANAPSGQVDWPAVIRNVLPYVDVFVPSIEEILFMLRRADYDRWRGDVLPKLSIDYLRDLATELLGYGAAVAGFKLGHLGLYLLAGDRGKISRLSSKLPINPDAWARTEVYQPAFQVDVAGTTGAGDSAFAGLLAALRHGFNPLETARLACAVGACNVEAPDSNSGIRPFSETLTRIEAGWPARPETLPDHIHAD